MYNIDTMSKGTFNGGVFLSERKEYTVDKKTKAIPAPREIILPLSQHIGSPNEPLVKPGDNVKLGQRIGESKSPVSAPVHSPVSGRVKSIQDFSNPIYRKTPAVVIENDGNDESVELVKRENPEELSKQELIRIIRDAGVVGLGGATFPTHIKLNVPGKIDTLIINGAECEPYLTCDHRLMIEKTNEILNGIYLLARILEVSNIFLAIEDNKLSAIFAMEKAIRERIKKFSRSKGHMPVQIVVLKAKYPQGGENQLIKAILKKEVLPGKFPTDMGIVVQNVGTCFAIYQAAYEGKPLIERCVTFTGGCLKEPGNFIVRFGTLLKDAIEFCGGFRERPAKIIIGGPMMGIAQYSLDIPTVKGVTGVIFLSKRELKFFEESTCIRCARCVDVCPVNLVPTEIMRMVKYSRWHYLDKLHPGDCIECGACAYACASKVPLVQYIKLAKLKEAKKK
ncbi:MAG: electron transport complex subunit RsxC [Candidatus Omnitrophota bacterium]|nr:MAG: electron transport complex subunit RsxC [Candidatus Omnitrophota bacterium]